MNTKEPRNHLPPFRINDTFRTVWVKHNDKMTEARWKIRYFDGISGLPTSVELETIEDVPVPLGRVDATLAIKCDRPLAYVFRPVRTSLSSGMWTDIKWKCVRNVLFVDILDACQFIEQERNSNQSAESEKG